MSESNLLSLHSNSYTSNHSFTVTYNFTQSIQLSDNTLNSSNKHPLFNRRKNQLHCTVPSPSPFVRARRNNRRSTFPVTLSETITYVRPINGFNLCGQFLSSYRKRIKVELRLEGVKHKYNLRLAGTSF